MKEVKDKLLTSEQCIEQLEGRAKVSYMHALTRTHVEFLGEALCINYLYTFHTFLRADFCFLRYEQGLAHTQILVSGLQ